MKKIFYYLIAVIIFGSLFVSFWTYQRYFKKEEIKFLQFIVQRGDIEEQVKARGEAVAPKEFDLEFSLSGRIDNIFVEEGGKVKKGDALLSLETTDLNIEKNRLKAILSQRRANLNKLIAGATKEDLKVSEAKVTEAKQALDDAEKSLEKIKSKTQADLASKEDSKRNAEDNLTNVLVKADVDLANVYDDVPNILNDAYIKADDAVHKQVDALFDNDDSYNPDLSFGTSNTQSKDEAEFQRVAAGNELKKFQTEISGITSSDYSFLDQLFIKTRSHLNIIDNFLEKTLAAVNDAVGLGPATTDTYKYNVNLARTNINSALTSISNQEQAIAAQKATNDNLITAAKTSLNEAENALSVQEVINQNNLTSAEASVNSAKNALVLSQNEFDFKKAGTRSEDIEIAKAQVAEIKNQILSIEDKIDKATLFAPMDAKVAKIWLEKQEMFRPGRSAISLFAQGFKIQADVSELEINKVKDGAEVLVSFDALPRKEFKGKVISIDPKEIIKEGDTFYRVNVYIDRGEDLLRSGMNADLNIKVSFKKNVLKIPELAVSKKDGKEFVIILKNNKQERKEIETGISDGENIEVKKGLKEGQIIVVAAD